MSRCVIGDFSDILHVSEKKGRTDRPTWLINGFREAVSDAGLIDIHMEGYDFTWFKSLGTVRVVEEKLDRNLATDKWFDLFPIGRLRCLTTTTSNYYPLLVETMPKASMTNRNRQFCFENSWSIEPEFCPYVIHKWEGYGHTSIMHKLENCTVDLQHCSKDNCQPIRKEIENCRKKLERVRTQMCSSNINYFNALRRRLKTFLVKDEVFRKQRAKIHWYREGDLNTKFFHASETS